MERSPWATVHPAPTAYGLHGVLFIHPQPAGVWRTAARPPRSGSCSSSANRLLPRGPVHPTPTGWGGAYARTAATGTVHPQPTNRLGQLITSHSKGLDATRLVSTRSTYRARGSNGDCSSRGNQPARSTHVSHAQHIDRSGQQTTYAHESRIDRSGSVAAKGSLGFSKQRRDRSGSVVQLLGMIARVQRGIDRSGSVMRGIARVQ